MLGVKLRELRETNGMVQRQIAALLEVDTAFISKVEKEEKQISKNHIARLAKLFRVSETELNSFWVADKILALIEDEKKENIERILDIVSVSKNIKVK
jgi:transcriptional regulator with XRE-family HTH domain